jgi:hypothetical protein
MGKGVKKEKNSYWHSISWANISRKKNVYYLFWKAMITFLYAKPKIVNSSKISIVITF